MKKFISLFTVFISTCIFLSAQGVEVISPKTVTGTYLSEEYFQYVNTNHSMFVPCFSLSDEGTPSERQHPNILMVTLEHRKTTVAFTVAGEYTILKTPEIFKFYKYKDTVYCVDDRGAYYFRVGDLPKNDIEADLETADKLFKNFLENLYVPFVRFDNLKKYDLKPCMGYGSPYWSGMDEYGNKICTDYLYDLENFCVTEKEIRIFSTESIGRYEYAFGETELIIPIHIDNFEYCQRIVKRPDDIVPPEILKKLSKTELRILRNTIYAKYGYKFKSQDLADYFSDCYWYKPVSDNVDDKLTLYDLRNIEIISALEK